MRKTLATKFGRVVQQDYGPASRHGTDVAHETPSIPLGRGTQVIPLALDSAGESTFPPPGVLRDGDPVLGPGVRRILVCSFAIRGGCPLYFLFKYPASEMTCPDLMVFPFCIPSRAQSPIGDALDEFGPDLGIDQEGYAGWTDLDGDIVLFFQVSSCCRLPVGPALWAVAPDEIANIGGVHGFPIHDSVRGVLELDTRLLSGPGPALRAFYAPEESPVGITQLSALSRKGGASQRVLLPDSKAKYAFGCKPDSVSTYDRIWSAWRSGYGLLYTSGRGRPSWYCRDPDAAVLRSEV